MDFETILPLLMKNGSNPQMATMMSALSGDRSKMMEALMGDDPKNKELFGMINMMQQNKKPSKPHPRGLKAIYNFAPKDILGIMVKYYSR